METPQQGGNFGIRKIVDCKLSEGGQQMYKVEWESTWEPAESLSTCQNLIDDFWSLVNKAKQNQQVAQEYERKNGHLKMLEERFSLSNDDKTEIQNLITKVNNGDVGSVMSPSNHLQSSATTQHTQQPTPSHKLKRKNNVSNNTCDNLQGASESKKTFPPDNKSSNTTGLKYLEGFTNPYVKIILVCKICSKEQKSLHPPNWKQHYMTHEDKKPHSCTHCSKSFVRADYLRKHIESQHSSSAAVAGVEAALKGENYMKSEEQYMGYTMQ